MFTEEQIINVAKAIAEMFDGIKEYELQDESIKLYYKKIAKQLLDASGIKPCLCNGNCGCNN